MPKVSIIVPVYNVETLVSRTIESVLSQTFNDFELILVNDGSTDNSLKICQDYELKDTRIKLIDQPNNGSGLARNSGLKIAKGDYISFVDADDYVDPNLLEDNLIIARKKNAELVVFGHWDELITIDNKIKRKSNVPSHDNMESNTEFRWNFGKYYEASADVLWNKLYKRDFLTQHNIQFTDQKVGQDALFNVLVYKNIERVFFNQNPYYHYVHREGSAVNTYHPFRFDYEYNVSNKIEKLVEYWKMLEEHKSLINHRYWNTVYIEMKQFTYKDCPFSYQEKVSRLRDILNKNNIKKALNALDEDNNLSVFSSLVIRLLKLNRLFFALLLFDIRFSL